MMLYYLWLLLELDSCHLKWCHITKYGKVEVMCTVIYLVVVVVLQYLVSEELHICTSVL